MRKPALILLLPAVLSMVAGGVLPRLTIDPLARSAASVLGWLAFDPPQPQPSPKPPKPTVPPEDLEPTEPSPRASPRSSRTTPPKPSGGILVRRDVVRAAVQRGIRPSASPVPATADRPAGLVVYGWGAAGAGLADGDIITMVGGRQPTSVDDIVIAVAGAYKSPHKVVSGQIWRKGRILAVTVELPTGKTGKADKAEPAPASGPVAQRASSSAAGAP